MFSAVSTVCVRPDKLLQLIPLGQRDKYPVEVEEITYQEYLELSKMGETFEEPLYEDLDKDAELDIYNDHIGFDSNNNVVKVKYEDPLSALSRPRASRRSEPEQFLHFYRQPAAAGPYPSNAAGLYPSNAAAAGLYPDNAAVAGVYPGHAAGLYPDHAAGLYPGHAAAAGLYPAHAAGLLRPHHTGTPPQARALVPGPLLPANTLTPGEYTMFIITMRMQ